MDTTRNDVFLLAHVALVIVIVIVVVDSIVYSRRSKSKLLQETFVFCFKKAVDSRSPCMECLAIIRKFLTVHAKVRLEFSCLLLSDWSFVPFLRLPFLITEGMYYSIVHSTNDYLLHSPLFSYEEAPRVIR